MAEKYELAKVDYDNGMKYKDIAKKYDVTINTVKSWKTRKWNKTNEEADKKSVHTKEKGVHTKKKQTHTEESTRERLSITEESLSNENSDLTDKQRLFCIYYTKYWNATKAYQKVYESTYATGRTNGSRLLTNANIRLEIERLKKDIADGIMIDARAVLQKYIDVAFADIGDYVEFGTYAFTMKDLSEVDTSIITEASNTEDGIKFKLADKMKALDFLAKYTDLLNENELKRLKVERERVMIEKTRSDMTKDDIEPIQIEILGVGEDDD